MATTAFNPIAVFSSLLIINRLRLLVERNCCVWETAHRQGRQNCKDIAGPHLSTTLVKQSTRYPSMVTMVTAARFPVRARPVIREMSDSCRSLPLLTGSQSHPRFQSPRRLPRPLQSRGTCPAPSTPSRRSADCRPFPVRSHRPARRPPSLIGSMLQRR